MLVLFVVPYPLSSAPSQRFRFEQYLGLLQQQNVTCDVASFFSANAWRVLYKENQTLIKVIYTLQSILGRLLLLLRCNKYDLIYIHRFAIPIGPPIFEWVLSKVLGKKIIYDFDDAIWIEDSTKENKLTSFMKPHLGVKKICTWSYKVSCGNNYLADYAKKYNKNVIVNPTTIDTEYYHNPELYKKEKNRLKIGWTGTHSTIKYLDEITGVISQLEEVYEFDFVVIANKNPNFSLKSFQYIEWNKDTELQDLYQIDIGLMPLFSDEWSNGKCGFKSLQYMSMGIPTIASTVGVNVNIINDGVNGYLSTSQNDWYKCIELLILNKTLRNRIGNNGRKTVVDSYSVKSNNKNVLQLFN